MSKLKSPWVYERRRRQKRRWCWSNGR